MSLMDREYLTQPGDVALALAKKCAGCVVALRVAADVVVDWMEGEIRAPDLEREYDMRIGAKCQLGLIELSDEVKLCLLDPANIAQKPIELELPTLRALD